MKILYPNRIFLMRGNHETKTVNVGYDPGFMRDCVRRYGEKLGNSVWEAGQAAFQNLPFAASIDNSIFCTHGGLPRLLGKRPECDIVKEIKGLRVPWDQETVNYDELFSNDKDGLAFDLLWSDPMHPNKSDTGNEGYPDGFGPNPRGTGPASFSKRAVEDFLRRTGFTHIIRAHEAVDVKKKKNHNNMTTLHKIRVM